MSKFKKSADFIGAAQASDSIELKTDAMRSIPYLQPGSALVSLLAFQRRTVVSTSDRMKRVIFGDLRPAPDLPNLLGAGFNALAEHAFAGQLSGEDVLMRHTLIGFYGRLVTPSDGARWRDDLANCRRTSVAAYLDTRSCGPLTSLAQAGLRKCPSCVALDVSEGALPSWRVLHQLPFLTHCPQHGELLVSHCPSCSAPFDRGRNLHLPTDPCLKCGSTEPLPRVAETLVGQLRLGRLCERIFWGRTSDFEPERWVLRLQEVIAKLGGTDAAVAHFENELKAAWNVQMVERIADGLGCTLTQDFVSRELNFQSSHRMWLPKLLIRSMFDDTDGEETAQDIAQGALEQDKKRLNSRDSLLEHAIRDGIPVAVIERLLAGEAKQTIISARGISNKRLRNFVASLPPELSHLLHEAHEIGIETRRPEAIAKRTDTEGLRQLSRRILLDAKAADPNLTRTKANELFPTRYHWLASCDREFLDAVLPSKRSNIRPRTTFRDDEDRKEAYRNEVLAIQQEKPGIGRWELKKLMNHRLTWLMNNDRAWCDENVPPLEAKNSSLAWYAGSKPLRIPEVTLKVRYRDDQERTVIAKEYVEQMKNLNPDLNRADFIRLCGAAIGWLRQAEPAWIEERLPKRRRPSQQWREERSKRE